MLLKFSIHLESSSRMRTTESFRQEAPDDVEELERDVPFKPELWRKENLTFQIEIYNNFFEVNNWTELPSSIVTSAKKNEEETPTWEGLRRKRHMVMLWITCKITPNGTMSLRQITSWIIEDTLVMGGVGPILQSIKSTAVLYHSLRKYVVTITLFQMHCVSHHCGLTICANESLFSCWVARSDLHYTIASWSDKNMSDFFFLT